MKRKAYPINRIAQVLIAIIGMLSVSVTGLFAASCDIGAFVGNDDHRAPYDYEVRDFENITGHHLDSVQLFWAWNDGSFPGADLDTGVRYHDGYNTQTSLQLTWEPWSRAGGTDASYTLPNIINGTYDSYITQFANDCYSWQAPIRLRFAHEMITPSGTDNWYPWQNNPTEYTQAWRHIYNIFEQESASRAVDNVEFVWAPLGAIGNTTTLQQYYPGQEYVDWIGMGGHNAGEDGEPGWPYWQNFDDLFANVYNVVTQHPEIFGDKEMMIAEFSSADGDSPSDKATWIAQAFSRIKNNYTKISAFYWFNTVKEHDWRINSTPESLAAFQYFMEDEYFTSHVVPEPSGIILFGAGLTYLLGICKRINV
ncbi:MAG: PEP-CTERM sorting domain-containing protein [PVC group bacterium]|nr:PEP-CTERM sorting domain-containing protein [PVC group bacterium]